MKVAFCLFGLSGGFSERIEGRRRYSHKIGIMHESLQTYKKNILEFNKNAEFDNYLHTREHKDIPRILRRYNPKRYIIDKRLELKGKKYQKYDISNCSVNESISKVLGLIDRSIKYDLIFLIRFDLTFCKPFDLSKINLKDNEILFPPNSHHYWPNGKDVITHIEWLVGKKREEDKTFSNNLNKNEVVKKNKDPSEFLLDWWFIFKPTSLDTMIEMTKTLLEKNLNRYNNKYTKFKELSCTPHRFYYDFLKIKNYNIVIHDSDIYDFFLTRQFKHKIT